MIAANLTLQEHGVEIKSDLISNGLIQSVISEINASNNAMPKYGIRNADKKFTSIFNVAHSQAIIDEATKILGSYPQLVRSIFFDKTPKNNWLVTWHQDKTVAVNNKFHLKDWGPWTVKDGIIHVQPPIDVLNKIITFRIHLDSADEENGCLRIISKSHNRGILKQKEIIQMVDGSEPIPCCVDAGDTVIMRPHILHSSSKAIIATHRRVIHLEFSTFPLPNNISWA